MRKAQQNMWWIIIVAALAILVFVIYSMFTGKAFFAADGTISPALLQGKIKTCRSISTGASNYDGDEYDDSCDPCIDIADFPENDGNGNLIADYCEAKDSSERRIHCYGIVTLDGKVQGSQCCSTDVSSVSTKSGLTYTCQKSKYASKGRLVGTKP